MGLGWGLVADLATVLAFSATPAACILGESLKAPFLPAWAPGTRRPSFSMARMLFRIQKGLAEGSLSRIKEAPKWLLDHRLVRLVAAHGGLQVGLRVLGLFRLLVQLEGGGYRQEQRFGAVTCSSSSSSTPAFSRYFRKSSFLASCVILADIRGWRKICNG